MYNLKGPIFIPIYGEWILHKNTMTLNIFLWVQSQQNKLINLFYKTYFQNKKLKQVDNSLINNKNKEDEIRFL